MIKIKPLITATYKLKRIEKAFHGASENPNTPEGIIKL